MARLANRLTEARQQHFVGRRAELELFRAALSRDVPDFAVLHLYGPGGMGKTTLLREFARIAEEAGRPHILLDGRHLDASPVGFLTALQMALTLPPEQSPLAVLAALPHLALLLDTYELLMPLDSWLRESFLPELPEQAIVVIAGRQPPPATWRTDGGWGDLTRIISLRNLRPDESETYLRGQGLAEGQIAHVLGVTYGHPLALSLAADLLRQNQDANTFDLKQDPDIVRLLLERFVADVPNPIFRQALEICAHAFTTDEALLAHCLGQEHAYAAFQWLRDLSFIEQGPLGLFPHDLARELLETDLRWRNLPRFRELHFQVRHYIIRQIQVSSGPAQQHTAYALLFLHRNNPFMRPYFEWQSFGELYIDMAQPADMPAVEAMIRRHQGEASVAVYYYWRGRAESTLYLFRAANRAIVGFGHTLDISQVTADDLAADPAVQAAITHLQATAPPRPGDVILYLRNWMDAEHYQMSPIINSLGSIVCLRLFLSTPRLAYTFSAESESDYYAPMYDYLRMPLAPTAGFVMDGQSFGVFVHDWRAEPVAEWLDIMGEQELQDEITALESRPLPSQTIVLSEPEFAEAVRQALRDIHRSDLLAQNPLLHSRCLVDRTDQPPTPADLQRLLREAVETLAATPKTQKQYRVLWRTHIEPAPTQEAAAELLDLPFGTYRYQLSKAIEKIITWLWQRELYGPM